MIPHRTPFLLPWIYPSLTWRVPTDQPELYLTFDDGPVDGPTDFVLEELARASINATFFCIGDNIRKHTRLFEKVFSSGHAIGNHTFHHLNGWKTETATYVENIHMLDPYFDAARIERPKLFRPPYGKITFRQIKALQGFNIVMWDVLSFDFDKNIKPETCLRKTISATRPGSIVVFHDSFKAEKNLRYVLPRYIEHFAAQKFQFRIFS